MQPHESKEFLDSEKWRIQAREKRLATSGCIASWIDICGFGNLLKQNEWDLNKSQDSGVTTLLNEVYFIAGRVLLPNVHPMPSEKIIVLNDGIAKTVDLEYKHLLEGHIFLFFFRDSLFNHYYLLDITSRYGVGIRTVLAGGERVQFAAEKITGHSMLYYNDEKISEYGQKLLNTQFVYNPSEFQMNTAFAKAYTIDSLGTKEGFEVNGLYIESTYFDRIRDIKDLTVDIGQYFIKLFLKGMLMFQLSIACTLNRKIKGLRIKVYHIDHFQIMKEFDGDDVDLKLFNLRK
ncbi:MAG: hypothetical protein R2804_10705 [Cyclobacteriaceae bacterium]